MKSVHATFRPEFINRLDEIIMFKPLLRNQIGDIIDLIVAEINERIADKELKIDLSAEAKEYIIEHGFDPQYGARPLRRYIQRTVETLAAKLILEDKVIEGDTIEIAIDNSGLVARKR